MQITLLNYLNLSSSLVFGEFILYRQSYCFWIEELLCDVLLYSYKICVNSLFCRIPHTSILKSFLLTQHTMPSGTTQESTGYVTQFTSTENFVGLLLLERSTEVFVAEVTDTTRPGLLAVLPGRGTRHFLCAVTDRFYHLQFCIVFVWSTACLVCWIQCLLNPSMRMVLEFCFRNYGWYLLILLSATNFFFFTV